MKTRPCRASFPTVIAGTLVLALASGGLAQTRPLEILLTNDDGFDSSGLTVMRTALVKAGHHVTVVAPATNVSASSMSTTSGVIRVERRDEAVWAVHGTPTDAALIGLAHILRETPPDLVISGTNAGQNLGTSTNGSGTVSAALAAARYGVPAIATSAGLGGDTTTAYAIAAALVNQMIELLDADRPAGGKLLPDRVVINLNVPTRRLMGVKWAPLSSGSPYRRVYTETGNPNEVQSRLTIAARVDAETDTDLAWFAQGYVTLTLLDGDVSIGAAPAGAEVNTRLSKLALPQIAP